MIKIPDSTKQFRQTNISNVLGNIWSSFNLDLTDNIGRIRVGGRGIIVSDSTDSGLSDLTTPTNFLYYKYSNTSNIWAISDGYMWKNAGNTQDPFAKDAISSSPDTNEESDMELFNSAIYVGASNGDIVKFDGSWSTVTTDSSANGQMCVYGNRLYFVNNSSTIASIDTDDVLSKPSGSPNGVAYTLSLNEFGLGGTSPNSITSIRPASTKIWIAVSDTTNVDYMQGRRAYILEWDGVSTQATNVYYLETPSVMALIIKDDIPWIVDADGKLLKFNGGDFIEQTRLPLKPGQYLHSPMTSNLVDRWMHPRGITIRNDRILILIGNEINRDDSINENLPSGVWEYDENIGLYHKYSLSLWKQGEDSIPRDYGQNRVGKVGALFYAKDADDSIRNGDLLMAARIFDGDDDIYVIEMNDILGVAEKSGYLVTTQIESQNVEDIWQKCYVKYKKFLDDADRVVLKYRTDELEPLEVDGTLLGDTQISTTVNISNYEVGDDVEITYGVCSGNIGVIESIEESGGSYTITFVDRILAQGASIEGFTLKARFQKWITIGEGTNGTFTEFPIVKNSTLIQLKCVMYFKGDDEVQEIQLINKQHLPSV